MHSILCDVNPRGSGLRGSWGLTVMATVLLSVGVGATTAAFALVNGVAPSSAPGVACETMLQISSDPPALLSASVPSSAEMREHMSDVYQTSYEAAGDAVGSWSEMADSSGGWSLAPLLAAGALALLVACTRGAASMLAAPPNLRAHATSALGALVVAALLINVLGLPALGIRSIAFAIIVSFLAAKFARIARKHLVPAIA
ncbi:MAG: hypothetical protein JWO39_1164 [Gemmatimonadetes bacterium]|nr:hypothetical protein [Gemmatimonadota bacterium]